MEPGESAPDPDSAKRQLPMWHQYRVERYPHFPGLLSGIRDLFGNELQFPSAFRLSRRAYLPKGIVRIVRWAGVVSPRRPSARPQQRPQGNYVVCLPRPTST